MVDMEQIFDAIEITSENAGDIAKKLKKRIEQMIQQNFRDKSPRILVALTNAVIDKAEMDMQDLVSGDYDAITKKVKEYIAAEYDVSFSKTQIAAIASQKSEILNSMNIENRKLKADLKRYMMQNLGGKLSLPQVVKTLQNLYPKYASNIYTLVNTYTQQVSKDMEWSKVSEIAEYFVYAGPQDEKNRPYCAEHVRKVYTKSEAEAIQAEIMTFYNCRHRLEPITKEQYYAMK